MTLTPSLRKLAFTAHVTSSVGRFGAAADFLALAVAGLTSKDAQTVRAAYLAMELTAWFVIIPLSLASPLTGLVQSLGTTWGLFRHYWVLAKFLITIPATIVLLLHLQPIGHLARVVAETTLSRGDLAGLRIQLVATTLSLEQKTVWFSRRDWSRPKALRFASCRCLDGHLESRERKLYKASARP